MAPPGPPQAEPSEQSPPRSPAYAGAPPDLLGRSGGGRRGNVPSDASRAPGGFTSVRAPEAA